MTKRKRPNGEGTIYYDKKKDLWRAMLPTPLGRRMTKSSKSEEVVKDWYNQQRLLIGRGKHIEPHAITVLQWITEWLDSYAKIKVKPRTYDRYVSISKHLAPIYQERLLALSPAHLQRVYNGMLNTYSPQTIIYVHSLAHNSLRQAVLNNLIHDNPADKVTLPKKTRKPIAIYTPDEILALIAAAENYRNSLVVKLTYATGLRLSEVLALRCEDIKGNDLEVNQTVHESTSQGKYYSDTKSTNSRRKIPIPQIIATAIDEHKLKTGIRQGLLFLNTRKTGESPHNYLSKIFSKIQEDAGAKKGFHCLRHTHATELLSSGIPIHDVSRRLGHAKASFTLDTYIQFMPASDERMISAIDILLNLDARKTKTPQ